ncbi:MAG: hypothetical protein EXS36_15405 [Pedosphaera sp.]|nr:hypothetical protein [Pedosphaera sp.]
MLVKFQRTTRIFRGQLDVAPLFCVLFPLAFFTLFHHLLVLPSGTRLTLAAATNLPVALSPGESFEILSIDAQERLFFENQPIEPASLLARLRVLASGTRRVRTLVLETDAGVRQGRVQEVVSLIRASGVEYIVFSTGTPAGNR